MFLIFILSSVSLSLWLFKKEMNEKMKYSDYVTDAIDGIYHDFSSNNKYAFTSTKGIAIYKKDNGTYEVKSQSKLYSTAIEV